MNSNLKLLIVSMSGSFFIMWPWQLKETATSLFSVVDTTPCKASHLYLQCWGSFNSSLEVLKNGKIGAETLCFHISIGNGGYIWTGCLDSWLAAFPHQRICTAFLACGWIDLRLKCHTKNELYKYMQYMFQCELR